MKHSMIPKNRRIPTGLDFIAPWVIKVWHHILFGGMILIGSSVSANPAGIVIFKDSKAQPDGASKVAEYNSFRRMQMVTNYFLTNGQILKLTGFQPQTPVRYPDLSTMSITDISQAGVLVQGIESYKGIIARYPKSEPFLQPQITRIEGVIAHVRSGGVFINGALQTKSEYNASIHKAEQAAEEHLEQTRMKRRLERMRELRNRLEDSRKKR